MRVPSEFTVMHSASSMTGAFPISGGLVSVGVAVGVLVLSDVRV